MRLPLQVGTSSLHNALRAALAAGPAAGLPWWGTVMLRDGEMLGLVPVGIAVLCLIYVVQQLLFAWKTRPADIVLGPQGLRLEGWGRRREWGLEALRAMHWSVEETHRTRMTPAYIFHRIFHRNPRAAEAAEIGSVSDRAAIVEIEQLIVGREPEWHVIARAEDAFEKESLRALRDTIEAMVGDGADSRAEYAADAEPHAVHRQLVMFHCEQCGAPGTPSAEAMVGCGYCGEPTRVPEAVRQRVREFEQMQERERSTERLLRKLLDYPGASRASSAIVAALLVVLVSWVAVGFAIAWMAHQHTLSWWTGAVVVAVPFAVAIASLAPVRMRLISRQAFRLVAFQFGALPPERPRAPSRCRQCTAPLGKAGEHWIVRCAYCAVENIPGLDIHREQPARYQQHLVSREADERRAERRRWLLGTVGSTAVAGAVLAGASVVASAEPPSWQKAKWACDEGDPNACQRYAAHLHRRAKDARHDERHRLWKKACKLGYEASCSANAWHHLELTCLRGDLEHASGLFGQVCRKHDRERACRAHDIMTHFDEEMCDARLPTCVEDLVEQARKCDDGLAHACYELGHAYAGVDRARREHAEELKQGGPGGRFGGPPATPKERACDRGDGKACLELLTQEKKKLRALVEGPEPRPYDRDQAERWLKRSCDLDYDDGCKLLERLRGTPEAEAARNNAR